MTVKLKQRIPDAVTHEQHEYIKYDIVHVSTYRDGFGGEHARLINRKSQTLSVALYDFDVEIVDSLVQKG